MLSLAVILVLSIQHASSQGLGNVSTSELDGVIGEVVNVTIRRGNPATLKYSVDTRNHTVQTIRVMVTRMVTSPAASVDNPVLVSVNQLRGVTSWQIPFIDQDIAYYEVGHVLCPTLNNPVDDLADIFDVTMAISTFSMTSVKVSIEAIAIEREKFILELDKPITVGVTSSSPVYYAFHFTPSVERVLIKVQSLEDSEDICAVASMQITSCPSDGVNNQLFSEDGAFQSMRSLAAITTDRPDSQNFFYLVVAVFDSSSDCRVSDSRGGLRDTSLTDNNNFLSSPLNRTVRPHGPVKNVTIVIEEALTNSGYTAPIVVSLMFFLVIFYGGALIEVTVVDYILHTAHWINFPTNQEDVTDQPDGGDLERGSRQSLRGSKRRRPSLLKVLTGTYLNDIMKDVLSQTEKVPQFYTASLRSDRTPLTTQRPSKPSDSGVFARDLESSLTQSLPPGFRYRADSQRSESSVVSGNVTTAERRLASSGGPLPSPLGVTYKASASIENEVFLEKQTSVESGRVQVHRKAAEGLNRMQGSSKSSTPGNEIELQPYKTPSTATTEPLPPSEPVTVTELQPHSGPGTMAESQPHTVPVTAVELQPCSEPGTELQSYGTTSTATTEPQSHTEPQLHTEPQSHTEPQLRTEPQSHTEPQLHTEPQSHTELQPHTEPAIVMELESAGEPTTTTIVRPYSGASPAAVELQPHGEPSATTSKSQPCSTPKPTTTAVVTTTAVDPTPSVKVQSSKEPVKELPTILEDISLKMPSPSVESQTAATAGGLFSPTSPSIASSQLVPASPQPSPVPPIADEVVAQDNIRGARQRKAAKDWMVVTLADVNICEGEEEQIRYRRYCWHLFTISIFYALPAFQLILTYQQLLNTTGNQDICYYNYLCSHKLGEVSAFNNVWSNFGYVALGVLFILLAARRQIKYRAIEEYNLKLKDPSCRTGVPQHFGIYYTIGIALVAEGLMSALYHVCPNDTNFQFDTAFMFIIAGLGIYQIFHSRHPEFTPNSHILYFSFALLIIVAFCGALYPSAGFWIVAIIVYLAWTVFVSFQFYYNGIIRLGNSAVVMELLRTNYRQFPSKPSNITKFIYVVFLYILNLALAIYALATYFSSSLNFNSFALTVMIANFTAYLFYYILVKCRHQENNCHWQHPPPKLFGYLLLAIVCWIPAIVYFNDVEADWTVSPARSRDSNDDCELMGFFNSHDIWHFLSAIALFFSLLMLMSLDDNREHVPRSDIIVF